MRLSTTYADMLKSVYIAFLQNKKPWREIKTESIFMIDKFVLQYSENGKTLRWT